MTSAGTDAADGAIASADAAWNDALLAAACIAVDPVGLGGVRVHAAAGPVRDAWVATWRALLPSSMPIRQVPLHVDDGRLFGGLDLAASLRTGHAVRQPGLLEQVDGGYAVLSMAERVEPATAARIAAALDGAAASGTFAVIAFDEGGDDERLAGALDERLALAIDLRRCSVRTVARAHPSVGVGADTVVDARARLSAVVVGDAAVAALCAAAVALGIDSMRTPLFALRVARAVAALRGAEVVEEGDATTAARLVFTARARRLAPPPVDDQGDHSSDDGPDPDQDAAEEPPARDTPLEDRNVQPDQPDADEPASGERPLDEVVLEAAIAAMPAGLLERLARDAAGPRTPAARGGGAGASARGGRRGAPAGVTRSRPRGRERLSLVDTLRAAAPWQAMRRAESDDPVPTSRVRVRAEDLHVVRYRERHPTTTLFVVDASGSSALHRLAEAKGAVERLLADCYVRRDSVAVLAFRGRDTQLLLPATRSLVRARRSLAGLPGGGGTPLASALDATRELVAGLRRRGDTVLTVLLTDGRANVARDGAGGRPRAEADALAAAWSLRAMAIDALLIDTSPQPSPHAARIAEAMGALYRPLPHAGANEMAAVVNGTVRARSNRRAG